MTKEDVAAALEEIGILLELKGRAVVPHHVVPQCGAGRARIRGRLCRAGRRRTRVGDPGHRRHDAEEDRHSRPDRRTPAARPLACGNPARADPDASPAGPGAEEGEGPLRPAQDRQPGRPPGRVQGRAGRQAQGLRRQDAGEDPRRPALPGRSRPARAHRPGLSRRDDSRRSACEGAGRDASIIGRQPPPPEGVAGKVNLLAAAADPKPRSMRSSRSRR